MRRTADALHRISSADADTQDRLDRIADFLVEDILDSPEEDILNEAADDSDDVARLAAEVKNLIPARAFELYRQHAKQSGENVIPFPIPQPPEQPGRETVATPERRLALPGDSRQSRADQAPVKVNYAAASPVDFHDFQTAASSLRCVSEPDGDTPLPINNGGRTVAKTAGIRNWKRNALVASATSFMLAAFIIGSDVVPRLMGPDNINRGSPLKGSDLHAVDNREEEAQSTAPEAAGAAITPQASALLQAPLSVPVKLREFRAANDGTCIPFIIERRTPLRTIDVALDNPDHFHESRGRNLCMLEWTVNPEATGVQGFDIEPPRVPGVRLSGTGSVGGWTKVRMEFTRDFTSTSPIAYTVTLKFNSAPPPNQVQQIQHTITAVPNG
jgi:hypothetical protein